MLSTSELESLLVVLRTGDFGARLAAAKKMRNDKQAAIVRLSGLLTDGDYQERLRAAWALGQIEDEGACPALIAALHDGVDLVRGVAAQSLGWIGNPQAVGPLLEALKEYTDVGVKAMDALVAIGESSIAAVVPLLRSEHALYRRRAAHILGELKSNTALDPLQEALADSDDETRESIQKALSKITGEEYVSPQKRSRVVGTDGVAVVQIRCDKSCGFVIWDGRSLANSYSKCWFCGASVTIHDRLPEHTTPFFVTRRKQFVCAACQHTPGKEERAERICSRCGYAGSVYVYTMEDVFCCPKCGTQTGADNIIGRGVRACPSCGFSPGD